MGLRRLSAASAALAASMLAAASCSSFGSNDEAPDAATQEASAGDAPPDGSPVGDAGLDAQDESLVLHMPFDEGAGTQTRDTSGSGMKGTLEPGSSWTDGKIGKAVALDGAKGYVEIIGKQLDLTTTFTVAIWVNLTTDQRIVSVPFAWELKTNGQRPQLDAYLDGGLAYTSTNTMLALGSWHHVAVTYDKGATALFVDGVKRSKKDDTIPPGSILRPADSEVILVGIDKDRVYSWVNGSVDELRIYERVLSAAEVAALAQ